MYLKQIKHIASMCFTCWGCIQKMSKRFQKKTEGVEYTECLTLFNLELQSFCHWSKPVQLLISMSAACFFLNNREHPWAGLRTSTLEALAKQPDAIWRCIRISPCLVKERRSACNTVHTVVGMKSMKRRGINSRPQATEWKTKLCTSALATGSFHAGAVW